MLGKEIVHVVALSVAALALAGCGGGGGGSEGGTGSAATGSSATGSAGSTVPVVGSADTSTQSGSDATPAAVSSGNAASVAGQVYAAANGLYGSGSTAAVSVKSLDAAPPATAPIPGFADFAIRRLLALRGMRADLASKASQTANQFCSTGGAMAVTILDADNDGDLSTGDSGTITFTGCREAGLTIDGSIDFAALSITGSAATSSLAVGVRFTYRPLTLGDGRETASVEGALSLQATIANTAPYTIDYRGTGTTLSLRDGTRGMTLHDFTSRAWLDTSAGTYAYSTQGTLTLDAGGMSLAVSSPTPLGGTLGSLPSSGVMVARAADGSATRLSVVSPASVTVETDGGAGAWDASQALSWTQLRAR